MNDEDLKELFEHEDWDDNEFIEIEKQIRRGINRRIYTRVIAVVLIISIIVSAGYFGTSYGLNLVNYNPEDETGLVIPDEGINGFNMMTGLYLSMYYPGIIYYGIDYSGQGFGKYEIDAKIQSAFTNLYFDGIPTTTLSINRSSLHIDSSYDHLLSRVVGEYHDESIADIYDYVTDYDLVDIEELPESAIIDVSLSFMNTLSAQDAIEFVKKYDDSTFVWLATSIDDSNQGAYGIVDGISLYDGSRYDLSEAVSNDYPGIYLDHDYTASDVLESYLSRMKLLLDHNDFLNVINSFFSNENINDNAARRYEDLSVRYDDVLENGISCIGVRGYVKKQDLLTMIDSNELYGMYINDVKLSALQR